MKSKYFGYTLRGAGTPYQQWVLSELPVSVVGVYTTGVTGAITTGSKIPVQSISVNQAGGRVNVDGSITLPQGLYKIEYSGIVSTTAASPVKIDVLSGTTVVSEVQTNTATSADGTFTSTISDSSIVKGGCPISIVNNSAVAVSPVAINGVSLQVFVTRLV